MKNMKKITAIVIGLFTAFVLYAVIGGLINKPKPSQVSAGMPSNPKSSTPNVAAKPTGPTYKNGTFTGQVATNIYGPVQVKVVIMGGKINQITFAQMPSTSPVSVKIAAKAEPQLQQETIKVQSASVAIISGATYDSNSYIQSLQSALDQAKTS